MTTSRFQAGTKRARRAAAARHIEQTRAARRTLTNTEGFMWLTVKQAAAFYRCSEATIRRRVDRAREPRGLNGALLIAKDDR